MHKKECIGPDGTKYESFADMCRAYGWHTIKEIARVGLRLKAGWDLSKALETPRMAKPWEIRKKSLEKLQVLNHSADEDAVIEDKFLKILTMADGQLTIADALVCALVYQHPNVKNYLGDWVNNSPHSIQNGFLIAPYEVAKYTWLEVPDNLKKHINTAIKMYWGTLPLIHNIPVLDQI